MNKLWKSTQKEEQLFFRHQGKEDLSFNFFFITSSRFYEFKKPSLNL